MLAPLAFAFVFAAASTTPCPSGDVPDGSIGAWTPTQARLSLHIDDDDVGHLRARLRWKNETDGAGAGEATLSSKDSVLVVTGARVRHGDVTSTARLAETDDADAAFGAFVDALTSGVAADEVRAGRARVAAVVQHVDDGATVHAAGACSARVVDVDVDALLTSVPREGGLRFFVPRVFAQSDVDVDVEVDANAEGAVWINGAPRRHARARDALGDEAADGDSAAFVVDVFRPERAGAGPRVHGGLVALQPLPASSSPAAAPASEPRSTSFSLVHAAVDLPRPLVDAPDELRVVFVVDASVSTGETGVARALQLVDAVLDELPADAAWALVTAARRPTLVVPPWRGVRDRHWPAVPVENGSNVADAVALARRIASDALPGRGRVIVLSDLQQRAADDRLAATIHPSSSTMPLVHVVALPADIDAGAGIDFTRAAVDDGAHARGEVAATEATGGVFVDADSAGGGDARVLARYLVRPTRLDGPELVVDGAVVGVDRDADHGAVSAWRDFAPGDDDSDIAASGDALPEFIVEGGGLRASWRLDGRARNATLRGRLWGTTVELPLVQGGAWPTVATAAAVAALDASLNDDEVRAAARRRGFVSRVTSLLTLPAWRPATPEGLGMTRGCGCDCCGHSCSIRGTRSIGFGRWTPPPKLVEQQVLDRLAGEAARRCDSAVDIDVEVGDLEILDVLAREGGACVTEFFWAQRLDRIETGDASFERQGVRTTRAPRPTRSDSDAGDEGAR